MRRSDTSVGMVFRIGLYRDSAFSKRPSSCAFFAFPKMSWLVSVRDMDFLYLSEEMGFYAVRDSISSMVAEGEM